MRHAIVGTAGHVDHGKTCLIKALTGVDTDRLKEEKQRGITIELGFADLVDEETGQQIGIIDVPGHERFIRNMLAGIGGIDLVLLVVAADEGVMPQTREHFDILKMLHIEKGIVAVTKADLAEREWLDVVREDIDELVKGTFLEGAPVVEVSSYTGENISTLKALLCEMARDCRERREDPSLFRLPVDRVFTMGGFGTVVTGTLMEGSVAVGDEIEIYPVGLRAKVRNLQVHGNMVERAVAGQRTAVNLANIKKEEVERGCVLAARDSLEVSRMLDVKIQMFENSPRTLLNDSRLHFYYGSAEALCKAVLLDGEALEAGMSGYAQLRFEEQVALRRGDRFILRFYSPLESIGGGMVLDADPPRRKRFRPEVLEALRIRESGVESAVTEQVLKEGSRSLWDLRRLAGSLGKTLAETEKELAPLLEEGKAVALKKELVIHREYLEEGRSAAGRILEEYHKENPVMAGMRKEEFRKRFMSKLRIEGIKGAETFAELVLEDGRFQERENMVSLAELGQEYSEEHKALRDRLERLCLEKGVEAPEEEELLAAEKDKKTAKQMLGRLVAEGVLVRLKDGCYIHAHALEPAVEQLRAFAKEKGSISLAEFRDLIGSSRKYTVAILEYLDREKITRMEGDVRILIG
ncbi:MAG: selenocysteine-specific translation elongation factor [Bacillota bacterium]|nr:selenocysteine-specific translation elongation factor [Bacillota bacterium]